MSAAEQVARLREQIERAKTEQDGEDGEDGNDDEDEKTEKAESVWTRPRPRTSLTGRINSQEVRMYAR